MIGRFKRTGRGFGYRQFKDRNEVECTIQQCSIATEDCLWLGCEKADPKVLLPGKGWTDVPMPEEYIANTRMHLNRRQVKALVDTLNHWLETTGELK